ncbi:MAG: hypothetical protein J0653_03720 [Deltaproteobacteria bacterium]|nr:hypothetical protein [Deltaproteobacteria bacterium]
MDQIQEQLEIAEIEAKIAEIETRKQVALEQIALQQEYDKNLKSHQLIAYERRMKILDELMGLGGIFFIMISSGFAITKLKPATSNPRSDPVS